MSESASPEGASSKPTRARKPAVKKPRKSRVAASEPAVEQQPAPAARERAPEAVEMRAIQLTAFDKASMIATAAYYRAEQRRFAAGHELEDWLAAEAEIEARLQRRAV